MGKRIVDEDMRFNIIVNGNSAQKELYDLEKRNRELKEETKLLTIEKKKLAAQGKKESAEYKNLSAQITENNKKVRANRTEMRRLQDQIGVTGLSLRQLGQKASHLRLQLSNMLPDDPGRRKLEKELRAVNVQMTKLRTGARATQGTLSKLAGGFNKYAAIGTAVIASITGVVFSFQKFIDFSGKLSDAQSNVQKTTGLTNKEVTKLLAKFGVFNTRTARLELLELAEEAGRLGIEGSKNIENFVKQGNKLKVALGDDLSTEQIREVGKIVNIYKVGAETGKDFAGSMDALGSAINEVSASGANQAGFLVEYLKRQAGVAAQAKLSAADNIGYAATFDEIGQSVEVAATAMNKIVLDMFENPGEYAKIAGVEIKEFNKLLREDSNEAMLQFLEGLNGNNEGLSVMVQKIKDLDAGGARGVQALSALATSTDLLRERQHQANKAQQEAVSLTTEYNLKNNNLAANLEKLGRRFRGVFASKTINKGLENLVGWLTKATGAIKSNTTAAIEERKELFKLESQIFNVNVKAEDRVKLINELKASYPELLKDIDAETVSNEKLRGALEKVNQELINRIIIAREQDKIDDQNETTADRLETMLERETELREEVADVVGRYKDFKFDADKTELENAKALYNLVLSQTKGERTLFEQGFRDRRSLRIAINGLQTAQSQYNGQVSEGNKLIEEREELMKRLGITNTGSGTNTPDPNVDGDAPNEGDTKFINGELYTFKNGRWVKFEKPETTSGTKQKDVTLDLLRKNLDLKNQLIQDDFEKELAILQTNYNRKIEALKAQLVDETNLKGAALEKAKETNAAINEQINLETEIYQLERGTLTEKYIQKDIEAMQAKYEREAQLRETAHNNMMASFVGTEEEKAELQRKFEEEELLRKAEHTREIVAKVEEIVKSGDYKGINLEILTDEQKDAIVKNLQELGYSLSKIKEVLAAIQNGGKNGNDLFNGEVDVLGFSTDDWDDAFDKLETLEEKIRAAEMGVGAFMNAWGMYHQFVSKKEQQRLREFEENNRAQQEALSKRLDAGLINQRQYDQAQKALELQLRKRQAKAEYEQAKRQKEMAIADIGLNTAVAVSKALAQGGFVLGVPWAAIVGALGAIQLGLAIAQPLPSASGYEDGYGYGQTYPMRREQDGKVFNVRNGGVPKSGVVSKPTHFQFMAAESGPELIISNRDWRRFHPAVTDSIKNELARVRGYEGGYAGPAIGESSKPAATNQTDPEMKYIMSRLTDVLERVDSTGVVAFMSRDMEETKKIKEDLDRLNKYRKRAEV